MWLLVVAAFIVVLAATYLTGSFMRYSADYAKGMSEYRVLNFFGSSPEQRTHERAYLYSAIPDEWCEVVEKDVAWTDRVLEACDLCHAIEQFICFRFLGPAVMQRRYIYYFLFALNPLPVLTRVKHANRFRGSFCIRSSRNHLLSPDDHKCRFIKTSQE